MSNFEKRVQLNKIIESQLPEFLVADFPKAVDFFRQYYISQEYQGGPVDISDNLDQGPEILFSNFAQTFLVLIACCP